METQFLWVQDYDKNMFVSQLSSSAGISVWLIVWVTINCCFMTDIRFESEVTHLKLF